MCDFQHGLFILQEIQKQTYMQLNKENIQVRANTIECGHDTGSDVFAGFVLKKKLSSESDLGFSLKALNYGCAEKNEVAYIPFIENLKLNTSKTVVHVSLNHKAVLTTFMRGVFQSNALAEETKPNSKKKDMTLLCHVGGALNNITNRRIFLTAFVYKRMLQKDYNCNIYSTSGDGCTLVSDAIQQTIDNIVAVNAETSNDVCDSVNLKIIEKLKQCIYTNQAQGKRICFDARMCIATLHSNRGTYLQEIDTIEVVDKNGEPTETLSYAARMKPATELKSDLTLHLTPYKQLYRLQCSSLLLQHSTTQTVKQVFCCCGGDTSAESHNIHTLLSARKKELWQSYKMKYGRKVTGEKWNETIQCVAVASLKLDLYLTSFNSKLKIGEDNKIVSRDSLFILYNYARLCNVKFTFDEKVKQGFYPPLPSPAEIDFTLLTEEAEWNITLRYLLTFENLLKDVRVTMTTSKDATVHVMPKYLSDLSRDMSSYYHQTKILLDPRPHLFPLMFARLSFAMALKQVMKETFDLLGIDPPEQM
ncbi:DALR anticodon-binding domain-containing protein 3-like isoform X2 [Hydractinia symbiolongicarpus]|uniref:DALR anticodon-binding domain-containing protein 3-like isoform X2 n=1 Tax=Hydractinia symbiolongicarpus TaxID=13093 RepID=UPI00254CB825|nr:DALR anticodon-binding domain-containing protein 3-like isoform X2 [Hydractinia symbiolongicarpus]